MNDNQTLHDQIAKLQRENEAVWCLVDTLQAALNRAKKTVTPNQLMFIMSPEAEAAIHARRGAHHSEQVCRISRVFYDEDDDVLGLELTRFDLTRPLRYGICDEGSAARVVCS